MTAFLYAIYQFHISFRTCSMQVMGGGPQAQQTDSSGALRTSLVFRPASLRAAFDSAFARRSLSSVASSCCFSACIFRRAHDHAQIDAVQGVSLLLPRADCSATIEPAVVMQKFELTSINPSEPLHLHTSSCGLATRTCSASSWRPLPVVASAFSACSRSTSPCA